MSAAALAALKQRTLANKQKVTAAAATTAKPPAATKNRYIDISAVAGDDDDEEDATDDDPSGTDKSGSEYEAEELDDDDDDTDSGDDDGGDNSDDESYDPNANPDERRQKRTAASKSSLAADLVDARVTELVLKHADVVGTFTQAQLDALEASDKTALTETTGNSTTAMQRIGKAYAEIREKAARRVAENKRIAAANGKSLPKGQRTIQQSMPPPAVVSYDKLVSESAEEEVAVGGKRAADADLEPSSPSKRQRTAANGTAATHDEDSVIDVS
jgi:hypothetical protein